MRVKVIILVAFLLSGLVLSSQQKLNAAPINDWQKLIQEGSTHKFDGQYNVAIQLFTKALNLAETQKLPTKCLPISLCRLAAVEVITHKITEADPHFQKIVDLIKQQKEAGTLDPQVSFWAAVLSDEYMNNKLPETREICLKRACYLKALIYTDTHKECTNCLNKLAECYIQNNKVEKAIHLLTINDAIMDKKYGKDPDRLGSALHEAAIKSEVLNEYEQAKQLELAVIKLAQKSTEYLSAGIPNFYCFLSINTAIQGKDAESKQYFQMALNACRKIRSSPKKDFMWHAEKYGHTLGNGGASLAIRELEEKRKVALTEAMTADPRWQCGSWEALTETLYMERKLDESELCLERAIKIAKLPNCYAANDVPELCLKLGVRQAQRKKYLKAYKSFADAYQSEKDTGGYHATLILFWWSYFLREQKQFDMAFDKLNKALKQASVLAPEKRGTLLADALEALAITNYELNKIEPAAKLKQRSSAEIQVQKKLKTKLGPDFFGRL
jgi:hypothetical protein